MPRTRLISQRGMVALMGVLFLMFMVGVMLVLANQMSSTDVHDSAAQNHSVRALFLAESAVERAKWRYSNGVACGAGLAETVTNPFGGGATNSFAILGAPAPTLVGGNCRLSARGAIGNIARTIVVDLQPGGAVVYSQHFSNLTGWTQVLSSSEGTSSLDAASNCDVSVCSNTVALTGSLTAQAGGSSNDHVTGYRWQTLPTSIVTGTGLSVSTFLGYAKHSDNGNPRDAEVSVKLWDTAGGVVTTIWADPSIGSAPACSPVPPPVPISCWLGETQVVALPASRTYNRIQLFFDLNKRGGNGVAAWFDAVEISSGGGIASVVRWTE